MTTPSIFTDSAICWYSWISPHLHQGARDPVRQHLERDQRADGDDVFEAEVGACPDDADRHHHFQHLADALGRHGDLSHLEVGVDGVGRGIVPGLAFHRLQGQGLDRSDAVDGLHQHALPFPFRLIELIEPLLEGLDQRRDDQRHEPGEEQHDQRQCHAVAEEEGNEDAQRTDVQNGEEEIPRQEPPDLFGLLHVLQQNAGGNAFEEVQRQPHQVRKGFGGGGNVDLVGHEEQQVTADIIHQRVEGYDDQHPDAENVEGVAGLIDQDLVHHDLEEEGDDQRKDGQQRHHQRDLAEDPFVFEEFRDEPAQAERLFLVGEFVDLLEQDEAPAEFVAELLFGKEDEAVGRVEPFRFRIHDDRLRFSLGQGLEAAQNRRFAAFLQGDAGKHRSARLQLTPRQLDPADLVVVVRGDLPEEVFPDLLAAHGVFVHDLPDVGAGVVVAGDEDET